MRKQRRNEQKEEALPAMKGMAMVKKAWIGPEQYFQAFVVRPAPNVS